MRTQTEADRRNERLDRELAEVERRWGFRLREVIDPRTALRLAAHGVAATVLGLRLVEVGRDGYRAVLTHSAADVTYALAGEAGESLEGGGRGEASEKELCIVRGILGHNALPAAWATARQRAADLITTWHRGVRAIAGRLAHASRLTGAEVAAILEEQYRHQLEFKCVLERRAR